LYSKGIETVIVVAKERAIEKAEAIRGTLKNQII